MYFTIRFEIRNHTDKLMAWRLNIKLGRYLGHSVNENKNLFDTFPPSWCTQTSPFCDSVGVSWSLAVEDMLLHSRTQWLSPIVKWMANKVQQHWVLHQLLKFGLYPALPNLSLFLHTSVKNCLISNGYKCLNRDQNDL